jgi:spore coat polysaccharide biosynthesis protein SpsF (cytidylyltransferase family)
MVVVIIQARMGSTRLPEKIMKEISGRPLLLHVIDRAKLSKRIDKVVVATTILPQDDIVAEKCREWGVDVFRGHPEDLLDRYYAAAAEFSADHVVRITADCPFIDPELIDMVVEKYTELGKYDTLALEGTYPDGLDTRIFSFKALEKAYRQAELPSERENVMPYIVKNFKEYKIPCDEDHSRIRLTVDEEKDLVFARELFKRLGGSEGKNVFHYEDIMRLLKEEPELLGINSGIQRNEGYLKSLKADKEFSKESKE